jgi:hypothetical protein
MDYVSVASIGRTERTLTPFSVDTIFKVGGIVPVRRTGKVGVPVNVVDARLVVSVTTIGRTERTLTPFSVDTIFKVGSTVTVLATGKVGVPVDVDSPGSP